ncbi:MAG: type II toxin-antitoxin system prevent-host-death family antitoxin [Gemmatimonadetes bacterium]|nr:type II toxin-antitoxin system prevent-host-death family antitoxin [Gemmatimonadota bacterium]
MSKKSSIVGARELKTRLGKYLARVRAGETILVTDRGNPIAELRPVGASEDATEQALRRMEAEGLITRATRRGGLTPFKPIELPPGVSASELILRERDEGF